MYKIQIFLLVFSFIMTPARVRDSNERKLSENLSSWMSDLPDALRSVPIINLAIPGSHDSMTYGIVRNATVAPDAEPLINHVYKVAPCIVRRWAKTQTLDASQQLAAGIRYFDLRFSLKRKSDQTNFYFVHGLFAEAIERPLCAIREFLDEHPREFVVLDCQHFYEFRRYDFKQLVDDLRAIFGKRIFGRTHGMLNDLTLELAERKGKQVLIIFRQDDVLPMDFWPGYAWSTPWPNQIKVKRLQSYLDGALQHRPSNSGYVSQCVLTPEAKFILGRFYSSLRDTCAETVRRKMFAWIAEQRPGPYTPNQPATCNVFIADFIDLNDNEFCKLVVGLNEKLFIDYVDVELPKMSQTTVKH